MSRKVNAVASAVVRSLKTKRNAARRGGRAPLHVAVASVVARRLAAPGKGPAVGGGFASATGPRLASKRGAKKRGRLSHPAERGRGLKGVPPAVIASAVARTLAAPARRPKPRRKSLAAAVASVVARRLAKPGKRRH